MDAIFANHMTSIHSKQSCAAGTKKKAAEENTYLDRVEEKIAEQAKESAMTSEEEMKAFKKEFYQELSNIKNHATVKNFAVNISEKAFEKMKEDPEYREKILSLIQRDVGDSYSPRDTYVCITIGENLRDYRADSWPVLHDSDYDLRAQKSFYERKQDEKKAEKKKLLEKYLKKRWKQKCYEREFFQKKAMEEQDQRVRLRKIDMQKAYDTQKLFLDDVT